MARIYISGPMTGTKDYKEQFFKAEEELKQKGHDVINPAREDQLLPNGTYEDYMDLDMFLLDKCDAIYLLKGWRKSCGANREYGYAMAKDYIVLHEE